MENFTVTCQLVPGVPHLVSGSCSSPRIFGLGFLQTPPHDDALALLLTFGSANTWYGDFHPISSVPCPAHTRALSRRVFGRLQGVVGLDHLPLLHRSCNQILRLPDMLDCKTWPRSTLTPLNQAKRKCVPILSSPHTPSRGPKCAAV